jgi:RHS repeat-associated protein
MVGDFTNYSLIFRPSSEKACNDEVLDNTSSYWYDIKNRSLSDTLYYYHSDHLGTPIAMTDSSGTRVWRAEHTPFGGIYALTVGTITNNLRFPGQYYDSETGLAQNWHRDYDSKIGRYREVDSVKSTESLNNYGYADNNPTVKVDFYGLQGSIGMAGKGEIKVCCRLLRPLGPSTGPFRHCYISADGETWGLYPQDGPNGKIGVVVPNAEKDKGGICKTTPDCEGKKACIETAAKSYPKNGAYSYTGPNSNTFASYVAKKCKLKTPLVANCVDSPGWGGTPPAAAR